MNEVATVVFAIVFFCLVVYPLGYLVVDGIKKFFEWQGRYR